jgi:hypothetical protein
MKAVDNMRILTTTWLVVAAGVLPITCVAQSETGPALTKAQYVGRSLCTKPDQIVFSCPLLKSKKIVSICASGNATPHHFYYAYGKPHEVEMNYPPASAAPQTKFSRAFIGFPGGTGGYAYSFVNEGIKYVVYSVSGAGFDTGGVIVQKSGELRAMSKTMCTKGMITEVTDDALLDETLKWKVDDNIHIHGLPPVN